MPVLSRRRQPDAGLGWFASEAGQGLLAVEGSATERVLNTGPSLPWLWIGVEAATPPSPGRRGLCLHHSPTEGGYRGAVRCGSELPFASETFGAVLVQHALDDDATPGILLAECERILMPGGTLWLASLNPLSPYRARWAGAGLRARHPGQWQRALKQAGFGLDSVHVQWLGPRWRTGRGETGVGAADRLRAGIALTLGKRPFARVPPRAVKSVRWQAGGAAQPLRRRPVIMRR